MVIQEPERQVHIQHSFGVKFGGSRLDRVDLETALYKKTSVHSLVYVLDPCVKIRQCGMLKFTTHTCFSFMYWFLVFGLTDLGFHEQIDSKQVYMV